MSPSKAFFISATLFFICNIYFWFFLGVSTSLFILVIYSYVLSHVVLHGSDANFVFSYFFFLLFSMP
jgi:hypothetical protein